MAAFNTNGLRRIAHGGNVNTVGTRPVGIWSYVTADLATDIETAGYFNTAYQDLAVDDIIWAVVGVGGSPQTKEYIVTASSSVAVTIVGEQGGGVGATVAARCARIVFELSMNLADITAADLITAYTPGFNGKILAINAFALKPATTASKAATLTPKINSTNVTGGALALTSANMTPAGAKVAGSAITALNVFTNTDTIGVVASGLTAFVEGVVLVVLDIENTDLKSALT